MRPLKDHPGADIDFFEVAPEVREKTLAAAEAFRDLGCTVEDVALDWSYDIHDPYLAYWEGMAATTLAQYLPEWRERMDPYMAGIVENGAEWYRQWGTEKSPGTKLFCVSGHVIKPGNYELPLGFPLIELIEDVCGGMKDGNALKAVIPGGSSVPLINAEEARACKLDYEGCVDVGTMLGCASVIVMDEATDIVKQVRRMVDFYAHESCGLCTPCREGTTWTAQILRRIENGKGTEDDLDTLMEMTQNMVGTTICVLSDSVAAPVQSSIEKFRDEYLALIRRGERVGAA